ncbi:MAG: hypothetical protein ACK50P_02530 [Planctomycetaceae bacterium]|jgi:hypothetical protein
MKTFAELAASRRAWLDDILKPWCQTATRRELLLAEHEWTDVAGKVDPVKTLWCWAWGRFPGLVNTELQGIDETTAVCVTLRDGRVVAGYPDARESLHGELYLLGRDPENPRRSLTLGPFLIDDVATIEKQPG